MVRMQDRTQNPILISMILIILKSSINPYQEINRTSAFIADLCLKYDVVISRHFISAQSFKTHNTPFLSNVRQEGISL